MRTIHLKGRPTVGGATPYWVSQLNTAARTDRLAKVNGGREVDAGAVAVRVRGAGKKQEVLAVEDFVERVQTQIRERALSPIEPA